MKITLWPQISFKRYLFTVLITAIAAVSAIVITAQYLYFFEIHSDSIIRINRITGRVSVCSAGKCMRLPEENPPVSTPMMNVKAPNGTILKFPIGSSSALISCTIDMKYGWRPGTSELEKGLCESIVNGEQDDNHYLKERGTWEQYQNQN